MPSRSAGLAFFSVSKKATRAAWSVDRLHPSALGHRELAGMALAALEPLGWQPYREFLAPSAAQPSGARRAWWLLRHGTPWFAKRSRDLLPELAFVCWRHHRTRAAPTTSIVMSWLAPSASPCSWRKIFRSVLSRFSIIKFARKVYLRNFMPQIVAMVKFFGSTCGTKCLTLSASEKPMETGAARRC